MRARARRSWVVSLAGAVTVAAAVVPSTPVRAVESRRLAGADRFATAVAISVDTHPDGADLVVLASGRGFADALAAVPYAAAQEASLLLSERDSLPSSTAAELGRLRPDRVLIVGGDGVVSPAVAASVAATADGADVERIAGTDRYDTAARISAAGFGGGAEVVFLATGDGFADALAGGAAAAIHGGPVLLTAADRLPDATSAELARLEPARVVVLGGSAAVSDAVLAAAAAVSGAPTTRIAGRDRASTSALVSQMTFPDGADHAFVASGSGFADALAGGVAAAAAQAPVLLVTGTTAPAVVTDELDRLGVAQVTVLGGAAAVSVAMVASLDPSPAPVEGGIVLDRGFGSSGTLVLPVDGGNVDSLVVDGSGRLVFSGIAGQETAFLGRLTGQGQLDPTFADDGIVELGPATGVVHEILGDGRIVVAHSESGTISELRTAVRFFRPDGTEDTGSAITLGSAGAAVGGVDHAVRDGDGRVVIVASTYRGDDPPEAALFRLDATGRPDGAFGQDGLAVVPLDPWVYSAAVDAQDRLLLSTGGQDDDTYRWRVVRVTESGSLDDGFDRDVVNRLLGPATGGHVVHPQSDGTVFVTSYWTDPEWPGMWRLRPDGSLDTTFGNGGRVDLSGRVLDARILTFDDGYALLGQVGAGVGIERLDVALEPVEGFGDDGLVSADPWFDDPEYTYVDDVAIVGSRLIVWGTVFPDVTSIDGSPFVSAFALPAAVSAWLR